MDTKHSLEELYEECLKSLQAGSDLDSILAKDPQQAQELKPLLQAALEAQEAGKAIRVPAAAQARSLARFITAAQTRPRPQRRVWSHWLPRLGYALLTALLLFIAGSFGVVAASARSLPGDSLYPVKIAAENTRLSLVQNPARRMELHESYDKERLDEIEELVHNLRKGEVSFSGVFTQTSSDQWIVADVRVWITPKTVFEGDIQPDFRIIVYGFLQTDGSVTAEVIQPHLHKFTGRIEAVSGDRLIIGGIPVIKTNTTLVNGSLLVGSRVNIQGILLAAGGLQASRLDVVAPPRKGEHPADQATETEPGESIEPTHEPGGTPGHIKPSETPEPSEETRASKTPGSTEKVEPSKTPKPTEHGDSSSTPKPSQETGNSATPHPTNTHEYSETPKPSTSPKPSETPKPTSTKD